MRNIALMLGRGTALECASWALLDLRARHVLTGLEDAPISIRPQDLADYVGLTLVHLNRRLRALRKEGVVATITGRIHVHDLAALHWRAAPMRDVFERERPEFGAMLQ